MYLKEHEERKKRIQPVEVVWEHDGRMVDPVYAQSAVRKIHAYEKNGIFPGERLILTFETEKTILDMKRCGNAHAQIFDLVRCDNLMGDVHRNCCRIQFFTSLPQKGIV